MKGSMATITCGNCGRSAPVDAFCTNPVFGDLPDRTLQCPYCHLALVRQSIDGRVFMQEIQPFLVPVTPYLPGQILHRDRVNHNRKRLSCRN